MTCLSRQRRLQFVTFLGSLATVVIERGAYFYLEYHFGFGRADNLWVGVGFGITYICGALLSHRICLCLGEKRVLMLALLGEVVAYLAMGLLGRATELVGVMIVSGFFYGMKWPVVESYVSAGLTPIAVSRAVGRFNISWAVAVPMALVVCGPLIELWPVGLFAIPLCLTVVSFWLIFPLEERPVHLPEDHPERLSPRNLECYRAQLVSSRWTMLSSYSLLFLMAPLMPQLFKDLGYTPMVATALAGLLDVVRCLVFVVFERYGGWHGRAWYLVACVFGLVVGFVLILSAGHVAGVLLGEVVFGLATGVSYYAALYYAMVVRNASVGAGGAHEGLIGMGFAIGPITGLVGLGLAQVMSPLAGLLAGASPLVIICGVGGLWPLRRAFAPGDVPVKAEAAVSSRPPEG